MKRLIPALLFLLMSSALFAQTATTTQDACNGKANQLCQNIPVSDPGGITSGSVITIDNRYPSRLGYLDLGPFGVNEYHGAYTGFVGNPDGTHNPFYGQAGYLSDDGTVSGVFQFYAYYVATCSGRACGGVLGWHYRILANSTVTKQ